MTKHPKNSFITKDGERRKILEELGEIRFLSYGKDHYRYWRGATVEELECDGWQEEPVAEEWPKEGSRYYFIRSSGCIEWSIWRDDEIDKDRHDFLGLFRTEAEAQAVLEKIKPALEKIKQAIKGKGTGCARRET